MLQLSLSESACWLESAVWFGSLACCQQVCAVPEIVVSLGMWYQTSQLSAGEASATPARAERRHDHGLQERSLEQRVYQEMNSKLIWHGESANYDMVHQNHDEGCQEYAQGHPINENEQRQISWC